ncbi:hypothetical protein NDU88_006138, partial [Pleurodeles waltl]
FPHFIEHASPVGGRLHLFLRKWELITADSCVLNIVEKGFALPFQEFPPPFPPSLVLFGGPSSVVATGGSDHVIKGCDRVGSRAGKGSGLLFKIFPDPQEG